MERLEIIEATKVLNVKNACLDGSRFECCGLEHMHFENVSLARTKITDANLSDLEIDGAQIGGAFIHNIGLPPEDHPLYDPNAKHRGVRFDNCNLENSQITNSNLSGVEISGCELSGMKINGTLVLELLRAYEKNNS
ncbi:pentapeptide repeat-containing protein [Bacillus alkalicellulosilyticus]|uniref:pentapeptide repeat-containing protein n=1 Tax=Alkalihalobacterium alkalicellulosilyticum TaxID=1912214 RepID=UPI000997936E|nr:pentapeptide repeat-containing protein [Bacillus alkalicellulosilyticus]